MSANARTLILALGALLLFGGTLLTVLTGGGGIGLMIFGALMMTSVAIERRYGRPGTPPRLEHSDWQLTNEKFIDDETGQALEVWMDPLTGERRYEPMGRDPRLPRP
jgi:hypothetical protein